PRPTSADWRWSLPASGTSGTDMIFALAFALLLPAADDGAASPPAAYRALQKAVEKRDVAALAAIIYPDERAWMRRDVARDGIEAVAARIRRGPLTVPYEPPNV